MERGTKTEQVEEAAAYLGLSGRTIWRRLAALPEWHDGEYVVDDLVDSIEERTCGYCGNPLPITASARRAYCDDICRQYARRRRLARQDSPAAA